MTLRYYQQWRNIDMKKGVYKSTNVDIDDNYGGNKFVTNSNYYLGIIDNKRAFFILGSSAEKIDWSYYEINFNKIDVKGNIIFESDNSIEIEFLNPYLNKTFILKGILTNDNLDVIVFWQDDTSTPWLKNTFVKVK